MLKRIFLTLILALPVLGAWPKTLDKTWYLVGLNPSGQPGACYLDTTRIHYDDTYKASVAWVRLYREPDRVVTQMIAYRDGGNLFAVPIYLERERSTGRTLKAEMVSPGDLTWYPVAPGTVGEVVRLAILTLAGLQD